MKKEVRVPEGIKAEKKGSALSVMGPKGTLEREFSSPGIAWKLEESTITLESRNDRRRNLALLGTFAAHMRNMMLGTDKGFEARLKAVYSHFPMKIKVEGNELLIQNFMGERTTRKAAISEGVRVDVKKDDIVVSGADRESVGQTAGRIEKAAKVSGFDRRVFQDGIHLTMKSRPQEG